MQGDETINKDNFFKLTRGRFEPCQTPRRAPDRMTKDSSYWFDENGVTRRSDHWGWGIATCTWTYGDEEACHCGKTKKLGERTGRVDWDALETPRVEIHLTHQFGDLDYAAIGAEPIGHDVDEYGPYDVFLLTRDMISEKGGKVCFAGNVQAYGNGRDQVNLSAAGEAYADPAARSISAAWKAEREAARAEKRRAKLADWLPTQVGDDSHGELAAQVAKQVTPAQWAVLLPYLGQDEDDHYGYSSSGTDLYLTEVARRPASPGTEEGKEAVYSFVSDCGYYLEPQCLLRVQAPGGADPMKVIASQFPGFPFDPRNCVKLTKTQLDILTHGCDESFDEGVWENTFLDVMNSLPNPRDPQGLHISPMLQDELDLVEEYFEGLAEPTGAPGDKAPLSEQREKAMAASTRDEGNRDAPAPTKEKGDGR